MIDEHSRPPADDPPQTTEFDSETIMGRLVINKVVYGPMGDLPNKCPESWRHSVFRWRRRKSLRIIRQRIRYFEISLKLVDLPEPGGLPGPDPGPIPLTRGF